LKWNFDAYTHIIGRDIPPRPTHAQSFSPFLLPSLNHAQHRSRPPISRSYLWCHLYRHRCGHLVRFQSEWNAMQCNLRDILTKVNHSLEGVLTLQWSVLHLSTNFLFCLTFGAATSTFQISRQTSLLSVPSLPLYGARPILHTTR
jgi:hypothetical protein